jgi:hypothetical protein
MNFLSPLLLMSLDQCSATVVPPQGFRCATNFYKKLYIHTLQLEKGNILSFVIRIRNTHTHWFIIDNFIQHTSCFILIRLHSYGQGFICRYIFMAMYTMVPPFCEAKFCGVLSCVFEKLKCVAGERLQNTALDASGESGGPLPSKRNLFIAVLHTGGMLSCSKHFL